MSNSNCYLRHDYSILNQEQRDRKLYHNDLRFLILLNCISVSFIFWFKKGYEPKETDIHDVFALSGEFGFELCVTKPL
jgi:hypothetical protein